MDFEFKRKDQLVHRLAEELKRTSYQAGQTQTNSPDRVSSQWTIAGVYAAGTQ